ncbi:MAG: prepilin peptidase [Candidatus Sericytochromatia bacterium]|nr:prepilin peptidase [Candidatus Sericytochromatia bacterium]
MSPVLLSVPASWLGPLALVFGAMIGSFLNVVIHRLPAGLSIVWPGSRCPHCATALRAWQNLPVVSFLVLRGRCASCRGPISWRYPVVEAVTGVLFWAVLQAHGPSWQTLALWVFVALGIVIFWIDHDTMLIHDAVTLPGIAFGLLYGFTLTDHGVSGLVAALGAWAFLLAVNSLSLLLIGQDGVGDGDMTLVMMLGAWLGTSHTLGALALALVVGSLWGLGELHARWWRAGARWPAAVAALATPVCLWLVVMVTGLSSGTTWWWLGGHLDAVGWGLALVTSMFLSLAAGWVVRRVSHTEPPHVMPFGPALVTGGIGALFIETPSWSWLAHHLGGP